MPYDPGSLISPAMLVSNQKMHHKNNFENGLHIGIVTGMGKPAGFRSWVCEYGYGSQ